MLSENQANTNTIIMPANYDIGHVLGTGGGGYGAYNSPCVNSEKAEGVSASSTPSMDPFDVDYVCHEIGHQFGAYHTFSASGAAYDNCKSSTISLTTSVEPGSGSTIMSYAGICLAADVQENSDPYFNAISLAQISTNIVSGNSSTCPMQPVTANTAPTANAGANYSIPISTPFTLTGAGNDPNGNPITYCWEQTDVTNPAVAFPFATQTQGAVFRSFTHLSQNGRYCQ
jgi:hypothetical protein